MKRPALGPGDAAAGRLGGGNGLGRRAGGGRAGAAAAPGRLGAEGARRLGPCASPGGGECARAVRAPVRPSSRVRATGPACASRP